MRRGFVGGFAGYRVDKLLSCIYVRMCTRGQLTVFSPSLGYSPCSSQDRMCFVERGHPYANMCV